ncbi:hypothetical protein E2C01_015469 [Portunus trituberculatus]|uniref:Uncharacterized protein n=1 Tax=Portunus trituberculatus TaxID=210409 RepID=A0A5B7DN52_PORTR|nr:hypothetical protein [Portunus trituberculatus]
MSKGSQQTTVSYCTLLYKPSITRAKQTGGERLQLSPSGERASDSHIKTPACGRQRAVRAAAATAAAKVRGKRVEDEGFTHKSITEAKIA